MSNESTPSSSKKPSLSAFHVREASNGKGYWTKIGAAYPHETGAGLTVILDALPFDNRIVLLEPQD